MKRIVSTLILAAAIVLMGGNGAMAGDKNLTERVEHHYADNNGVKIHYVTIGEGPMVLFIHGYPDFWYSWAHQIETLSKDYKCVALDLRGYNKSDQPKGVENYMMPLIIGDVISVIKANGVDKCIVVGHDWGGAISWGLALQAPQFVEKLIICNLPNPRGLTREMAINDEHRRNTEYARQFQAPDAHESMTAEGLVAMLSGGVAPEVWPDEKKAIYTAAFEKSYFEGMLNYYKANYRAEIPPKAELPYKDDSPLIKAKMPVLMFHGLNDQALHHHALNNTWEWVEKDLTIVTVPGVGHWVHHEAPELVSKAMKSWLDDRR